RLPSRRRATVRLLPGDDARAPTTGPPGEAYGGQPPRGWGRNPAGGCGSDAPTVGCVPTGHTDRPDDMNPMGVRVGTRDRTARTDRADRRKAAHARDPGPGGGRRRELARGPERRRGGDRSEEHTSELQSR